MTKAQVWKWCSKYIRLRDALEYCKRSGIDIRQFARVEDLPVKCCDCDYVAPWIETDAGHFFGRGLGGGSGVYFDERNIFAQSKPCNAGWRGDVAQDYLGFMTEKYGEKVIDELHVLHKARILKQKDIVGYGLYYKDAYEKLVKQFTAGTT